MVGPGIEPGTSGMTVERSHRYTTCLNVNALKLMFKINVSKIVTSFYNVVHTRWFAPVGEWLTQSTRSCHCSLECGFESRVRHRYLCSSKNCITSHFWSI